MGILDDFRWGDTVDSPGNWTESEKIRALYALQGKKVGDWKTDPETGTKYIDTPWGRIEDAVNQFAGIGEEGSHLRTSSQNGGKTYGLTGGRHANEHGSDAIRVRINEDGVVERVAMDRESEADRNWALAAIVGLPLAGLAAGQGIGGVTSLAGEGAAGGAGEIAAASSAGAAPAGAAPASGGSQIPPATDYGAPQNMVGGEAGSGGLGATPGGGAPIQSGPTNGAAPGSTVQNSPGLTDSIQNLIKAGGLTDSGGFWTKLLLGGLEGALTSHQKDKDNEALAERDKQKHEREVAENIRQEQWKVRNQNAANIPKLNWSAFTPAAVKPKLPPAPKPARTTISPEGILSRVYDEEDE